MCFPMQFTRAERAREVLFEFLHARPLSAHIFYLFSSNCCVICDVYLLFFSGALTMLCALIIKGRVVKIHGYRTPRDDVVWLKAMFSQQ